ncbi:hypothetical protein FHS51_001389 [Sphingobium wenxiniae]|uniref:Uncharacterized protein n=1 Tax=Sphingobium wenxiniae (strain DSM 21828 / CGMCC 1.7748 / JZ-1) TaxID=595605 RepID=A0A562KLC4_SPHWJ|nr:hypothetical protein [Sphingobium wenxiniae]MBB6191167.1 hypothetical protein [Sphingobium wenxiniae]TWH96033.1 hypothetical protein IQ35_01122 [Sphingobium wenxiniae]
MRHEVISTKLHPQDCRCKLHRPQHNRWAAAMEPGDLDSLKKGVIIALWGNGLIAAAHYAPTVIDWLSS